MNRKPLPGSHTYRLDGHRRTPSIILFTRDHQAGIGAHAGAVAFPSPAHQARLMIAPVPLRHVLPKHLRADGNVYAFSLKGVPGGGAGAIHQGIGLVLAWPHRPKALYRYDGRQWKKACGPPAWSISPGIAFCNVRKLGTYVAVR